MLKFAAMRKLFTNPKTTQGDLGWDNDERQRRRLIAFVKAIQVSGEGISTGTVDMLNEFSINVDVFDYENFTFELTRTIAKETFVTDLQHTLIEGEGHIGIVYRVNEPGQYKLSIRYLDLPVPCSPFKIEIEEQNVVNAKDVVASGEGLQQCTTGGIAQFHLYMRKRGSGTISITTSTCGSEKAVPQYLITKCKQGFQVQYVAATSESFFFRIKLNGQHIPGSPFLVIAGMRKGLIQKLKCVVEYAFKIRTETLYSTYPLGLPKELQSFY